VLARRALAERSSWCVPSVSARVTRVTNLLPPLHGFVLETTSALHP
jgi:hypothetical protein